MMNENKLRNLIISEVKKIVAEKRHNRNKLGYLLEEESGSSSTFASIDAGTNIKNVSPEEVFKQLTSKDASAPIFSAMANAKPKAYKVDPEKAADWANNLGKETFVARLKAIQDKIPAQGLPKNMMPVLPGPSDVKGSVEDLKDILSPGGKYNVDFESKRVDGSPLRESIIGRWSKLAGIMSEKKDPPVANQLKAKAGDPAAEEYLKSGLDDGNESDDNVNFEAPGDLKASRAIPTQTNILIGKTLGMALPADIGGGGVEGGPIGAYAGTDGEILDGHHRWAATMISNPEATLGTEMNIDLGAVGSGDKQAGLKHLTAIGNALGNPTKTEARKLRNIIVQEVRSVISERSRSRRLFEAEGAIALDVGAGPSAAVEYLNGPGADKRVRALLSSGKVDGSETDEAARVSETSAAVGELIPTQVEIELTKSIAFPLARFKDLKKMIKGGVHRVGEAGNDMIVKSGNLIVDGHHRWSSLFSVAGPSGVIAAIDIALPEKDAASVLAIVQAAIATTISGPVPKAKAGGMNILGKGKEEIASMIRSTYEAGGGEAGAILTDEYVSMCLADADVSAHFGLNTTASGGTASAASGDVGQKAETFRRSGALLEKSTKRGKGMDSRIVTARNTIINKVAENLSMMNQPAEGAPPRVDMPQLDKAGGGVKGVMQKLQSGEVNYKPPFESKDRGGQVVAERWQRLAGLIK